MCLSFDVGWERVDGSGQIYSWERVWHPVHPALTEAGPYMPTVCAWWAISLAIRFSWYGSVPR